MGKFRVTYHFEKELTHARLIEAENEEDALNSALPQNGNLIQYKSDKNVLYRIDNNHVKMISVNEYIPPSIRNVR